ncbi:MAG TPA: tail fiber protein [Mycobacteriales bacterium]|nr:tail fiber protein [Mycobacteriales bacterium]
MAEAFIGEVRIYGFNFAPRGWAFCNGDLLSISQNTALFSLLGVNFGGNGQTTFGLPDFRGGRVPISAGQGPGLSAYDIGQTGGVPSVTLTVKETPQHVHTASASSTPANVSTPTANTAIARSKGAMAYAPPVQASIGPMSSNTISQAPGGAAPHNNLMPYQVLNYCICLNGIYPQRP